MKLYSIALVSILLCASCSQSVTTPEPPSRSEIEAGIIASKQNSGAVENISSIDCKYNSEYNKYNCDVAYRFTSSINWQTHNHESSLCLKQKSDGVWRWCQSRSDYNIVQLNSLTQ